MTDSRPYLKYFTVGRVTSVVRSSMLDPVLTVRSNLRIVSRKSPFLILKLVFGFFKGRGGEAGLPEV